MITEKKVTCKWVIACSASAIDKDSNNLSLSNIIEQLTLTLPAGKEAVKDFRKSPPIAIPLDILALFERENETKGEIEFTAFLQLIDPTGAILLNAPAEVKMKPEHKRFRSRIRINAIPFTGPGEYKFQVVSGSPAKTGSKELGEVSIDIKVA